MTASAGSATGAPAARRSPSGRRILLDWVIVIVGALLVAFVVRTFVAQAFFIPTASMEPTLLGERRSNGATGEGDRVLVEKLSYHLRDVARGDVIVFARPPEAEDPPPTTAPADAARRPATPGDDEVEDLIKRVVGLPGESIVFDAGRVLVDGHPLDEPYLVAGMSTLAGPGGASWHHRCTLDDPCVVPDGTVWVMGDNRLNSKDSRYLGPIPEASIVGRAVSIVWPLSRAGGL